MNWMETLRVRQVRGEGTFMQLARRMGSAGGNKAALRRRAGKQALTRIENEHHKQIGMKLRDADQVFSAQDVMSIRRDQRKARVA